jgi:hypothetical protein
MSTLKDRLTKFVVTSVKPKATLETVKKVISLLESGPLDTRSKALPTGHFSLIEALLVLGIARRGKSPRTVELAADREELRSAIADLESLVSDNLILAEKLEAKPPYPLYENWPSEKILLEAWYMRSGWDMISLPKLSKNNIRTNAATYYIVPRSALSDLLLHICATWEVNRESGLLRLYWESPDSLYKKLMEGKSSREEFAVASPGELSHYAFDRRIKLEREVLSKMDDFGVDKARRLRDILFELEEDEGEHSRTVDCLVSIGESLGYEAKKEVDVGGNRVDVVWCKNGVPERSFEVVFEGSLEEALFKLGRVGGRHFLVVRQSDRAYIDERTAKLGFKGKVLEAEQVVAASQSLSLLSQFKEDLADK